MDLPRTFDRALSALSPGAVGDRRYLLAVSGGRDSMCMADLFLHSRLRPYFGIASVNFSLRGEDSDSDQSLVRDWAHGHAVPFHTIRVDTQAYAREHSLSVEMAARELRYGWFGSIMDEHGYDLLSIAHNRNDSVETLFLNLLRGSGIHGISGIRKTNGRIIRPLIDVKRDDIDEYVMRHCVPYRDDMTNFGSDYSRNKVRNLVFPVFGTINPSFIDTIARDMEYFGQAAAVLDEVYEAMKSKALRIQDGTGIIDLKVLSESRHPEYCIHRLTAEYGFNSAQTADIVSCTAPPRPGRRFLSDTHELLIGRDVLKICPRQESTPGPVIMNGAGSYTFGSRTLILDIGPVPEDFDPHPAPGLLYFDPDEVTFPLTCRTWRDGDRFTPFGMKGTRKLSDFFTGLGLDRHAKRLQPVICDASGRIVCIPPYRISHHVRLTAAGRTVCTVSLSPAQQPPSPAQSDQI